MIRGKLTRRVDLEKLTQDDFRLSGEFKVVDESYHEWNMKPKFKPQGTDGYVPFDQLFPEDKFHQCYELIVQTPNYAEVVGAGYLHRTQGGDVSFGTRSRIQGQEQLYRDSLPVWFSLLNDNHKPIVEGPVDLLFVKVSPWDNEKDIERQRVLQD